MGAPTDGGDSNMGLLDAIKEMVDKLRNECNENFCPLSTFEKLQDRHNDLSERVKSLEDKSEEQDLKLKDHDTKLEDHDEHF